MEPINSENTSINNPVSPSPIGQPKKPSNAKLVVIVVGAAALVAAGVFAAMYPWGASKGNDVNDAGISLVAAKTPTQTLTPTPSTSQTADETAGSSRDEVLRGWQTYRNDKYGFEVKYPGDQLIRQPLEAVDIKNFIKNIEFQGIKFNEFKNGCSLQIFVVDQNINVDPFDEINKPIKEAQYAVVSEKLMKGDKIYRLGMSVVSHVVDPNVCQVLLDQILSTFKFTK